MDNRVVASGTNSQKNQLSKELFRVRNVNISDLVQSILIHKWTQNHECLVELNAINRDQKKSEDWAINRKFNLFNGNCL